MLWCCVVVCWVNLVNDLVGQPSQVVLALGGEALCVHHLLHLLRLLLAPLTTAEEEEGGGEVTGCGRAEEEEEEEKGGGGGLGGGERARVRGGRESGYVNRVCVDRACSMRCERVCWYCMCV